MPTQNSVTEPLEFLNTACAGNEVMVEGFTTKREAQNFVASISACRSRSRHKLPEWSNVKAKIIEQGPDDWAVTSTRIKGKVRATPGEGEWQRPQWYSDVRG